MRLVKILIFIFSFCNVSLALSNENYGIIFYEDSSTVPEDENPEGERINKVYIRGQISQTTGVTLYNYTGSCMEYIIEDSDDNIINSYDEEGNIEEYGITNEVVKTVTTERSVSMNWGDNGQDDNIYYTSSFWDALDLRFDSNILIFVR
ncbi:MAG: hypothetical protein K2J82_02150 [Muribaculaceae bacterium]|nr:hypothetical protein [Muribaculaceae bacterium]MDE6753394.1 hypothetical protein [Muribaculaceae bacterium]